MGLRYSFQSYRTSVYPPSDLKRKHRLPLENRWFVYLPFILIVYWLSLSNILQLTIQRPLTSFHDVSCSNGSLRIGKVQGPPSILTEKKHYAYKLWGDRCFYPLGTRQAVGCPDRHFDWWEVRAIDASKCQSMCSTTASQSQPCRFCPTWQVPPSFGFRHNLELSIRHKKPPQSASTPSSVNMFVQAKYQLQWSRKHLFPCLRPLLFFNPAWLNMYASGQFLVVE